LLQGETSFIDDPWTTERDFVCFGESTYALHEGAAAHVQDYM